MSEPIWTERPTLAQVNDMLAGTAASHLGIEFTEIADRFMMATMPVDARTVQPFGMLHGGSSVMLAETLGSYGALWCVDRRCKICVGLEVNANHLRPARAGLVTGVASPLHLGRRTQVWDVRITNEQGGLVCVARLTVAVLDRPVT